MSSSKAERVFGSSDPELLQDQLNCDSEIYPNLQANKLNQQFDQEMVRWESIFVPLNGLIMHHFGLDPQWGKPECIAKAGVEGAIDFFFGTWRKGYVAHPESSPDEVWNEADCRQKIAWYQPFREALLLSLLLDDSNSALKLAQYPGSDAKQELMDASSEEHDFYLVISLFLREAGRAEIANLTKSITGGRKRRPKLWLKVFNAIEASEHETFASTLQSCLKAFSKGDQDLSVLSQTLSLDASILWNLGRINGLTLDLDTPLLDLILTPKSCGIERD